MKKYLKPMIALVLVASLAIGGTLAYLTDSTETVTNTFTAGENIGIDLYETDFDLSTPAPTTVGNTYSITPGSSSAKDPYVTVDSESEEVYIYVDVIENIGTGTGDFADYIIYGVSSDWELVGTVTGTDTVTTTYAYIGTDIDSNPVAVATGSAYYILSGDTNVTNGTNGIVRYNENITNEMLAAIDGVDDEGTANEEVAPTLSFVAYAVQAENLEATEAIKEFISYFKSEVRFDSNVQS